MRAPARAASWTARLPTPPAPVVLVDAQHPRLPRIVVDDVRGGELATRHLIELGHERIAFVGDTSDPRYESGLRGVLRLLVLIAGDDDGPLEERLELELKVRRTTAPVGRPR
jgi:DNA-binding LacI/PurR family transcriptional regulator